MEGAQVKTLIQKWRALGEQRKLKNAELDQARNSLNELESEHAKTTQQWELEKENIKITIHAIMTQVTGKKDELQRIEKETAELRKKVEERRRRNEEHLSILNKRRDVVEAQKKEADAKDAKLKDNLDAFLASRDESKKQLQDAIRKIEEAIPQEQDAHQAKIRQLKSRIAEMSASIDAEAKSWALEMAMREWNQKSDARKWLLEEVNAAEGGKDTWADVVHEINTLQAKDSLQSLSEIRSLISV